MLACCQDLQEQFNNTLPQVQARKIVLKEGIKITQSLGWLHILIIFKEVIMGVNFDN